MRELVFCVILIAVITGAIKVAALFFPESKSSPTDFPEGGSSTEPPETEWHFFKMLGGILLMMACVYAFWSVVIPVTVAICDAIGL